MVEQIGEGKKNEDNNYGVKEATPDFSKVYLLTVKVNFAESSRL